MKIRVRVHAGARAVRTERREGGLHVWVTALAVDGRANRAVAEALGSLFRAPVSAVRLVSGQAARTKTFEINGLPDRSPGGTEKSPPSARMARSSKA